MSHESLLGIRREDKNEWERRSPLTPEQVSHLIEEQGIRVAVQPSSLRAFPDQDYAEVGAEVREDLSDCPVVFGVKEMPAGFFRQGGCYVFFAHVLKGQRQNMGMLARMMELGCDLVDYEKMVDNQGRRLVFFGRFAGLAGMVNTLHGLGRRLEYEGIATPLSQIRQAREYAQVNVAKSAMRQAGERVAAEGLPESLVPLVIGVTGYGHVAQGALEILKELGTTEVAPEDLARLAEGSDANKVYHVVFREEHTVEPVDPGRSFVLQDYYDHPEAYRSCFERRLPFLTALANCIYWEERYPRLLTRDWLNRAATRRLKIVGDISCDVRGSVEATVRVADSGSPFFVYDPKTDTGHAGIEGQGLVVMAVDNLPCEFPFGSSREFGTSLLRFVPAVVSADYTASLQELELPPEIRSGLILHRGELTPEFDYISRFLDIGRGQRT
jgi:saccharopine dehydrogenase (NAD+, L-lysine-forming)